MTDGSKHASEEQSRQEKKASDTASISSFGSTVGLLRAKLSRKGKKSDDEKRDSDAQKQRIEEQSKIHKSQMKMVG